MPGVIDRKTGEILSMPVLTPEQKQQMAEYIAQAMVQLSAPMLLQAVEEYQREQGVRA